MDFEEKVKPGVPEYSAWNYFLRGKQNRGIAKCVKCNKVIKCEGSSTSGLIAHLRTQHEIILAKRNASAPSETSEQIASTSGSSAKKRTIVQYFSKACPIDAVLARLSAKDGISFHTICKSEDIRQGLVARGFNDIPRTHQGIRHRVEMFFEKVVNEYRKEFEDIKKDGRKLSLTFDEWTSNRNRRYMNVNAHAANKTWNLGLQRVDGSMNAERCVELLSSKTEQYGISLEKDVMAITTDGASVMKKVGNEVPATHQVCLAHGIHLAVIDVLYKKASKPAAYMEFGESTGNLA